MDEKGALAEDEGDTATWEEADMELYIVQRRLGPRKACRRPFKRIHERYYFEYFGRTKNGEVDLFIDHFFVDRCPLIDELVNRQVARGLFDYDLDKRPGNAQRIQESVQFTAQEKSKASANREILRGPDLSSHTFNGNNVNVQSFNRATIDKFYEELPVNTVTINTITTSKSRSKIQSARENFRRRRRDNAHYLTLINAEIAIVREMLEAVDPMKQLSQSLHRMSEETSQPASVTGNPVILGANLVEADFLSLIKRRHIVVAFKLYFNLSRPIGSSEECGMLNTEAEYYIAPTHIARDLDSAIANVEDFQLSTTTGQNFEFAGVVIMKVEIEHGIECEIPFFLVDSAKKILLRQPFVAAMKMQIEYRNNNS
ncbi:hypothetical protein BDZ45DRAFT_699889 [Acephala macrosclerotiorum]|nr:hypothetical protein BDZ45DRAFT_699889 [Acephala macrosclerotiorum]